MKRIIYLGIIFFCVDTFAQYELVAEDGDFYFLYTGSESLTILSSEVVAFGGIFESDVFITIKPRDQNNIVTLITGGNPVTIIPGSTNTAQGNTGTTIIRPRRPVPGIVGKQEIKIENNLSIYPNPVGSELNINSKQTNIIGYSIYDFQGRLIASKKTTPTNNYTITTPNLKTAIYVIKVEFENQHYKTIKFIKN